MLDDFFTRALIAGIGIALVAGPLGCFIIWRKLAYMGDTLSHAALLGVALALLFEVEIVFAVFLISGLISLSLLYLQGRARLSGDTLLGLLSHSALALGLVALAFMPWVRTDLMGLLFGDILAVSKSDLAIIWAGGACILLALFAIWRTLFAKTVNAEIAEAEGLPTKRADICFMILVAAAIAISIKIVGVLLITALLIIPAATARRFSSGPEQMAVLAALIGVLSVLSGLFGSLQWDTPSGPSIIVAAFVFFLVSLLPSFGRTDRPKQELFVVQRGAKTDRY